MEEMATTKTQNLFIARGAEIYGSDDLTKRLSKLLCKSGKKLDFEYKLVDIIGIELYLNSDVCRGLKTKKLIGQITNALVQIYKNKLLQCVPIMNATGPCVWWMVICFTFANYFPIGIN